MSQQQSVKKPRWKRWWVWVIAGLVVIAMIGGCEGSGNDEEVVDEPEAVEEELEEEPIEEVTDFLTAEEVIDRFISSELPVGETIIYDEETCPNDLLGRPGQYIGKADWEDTRVEQYGDSLTGGTIEVFENEDTLIKRKEYLEPFLEEAMFMQYMFIHKNVIVRVDKELTPSQAEEYKNVLQAL